MIDRLGLTLEDRCRAWLAAHPTPPEDEEDRICWQAMTNYVVMMDNLRQYGHVALPTDNP